MIQELTQKLKFDAFYTAFIEQESNPAFIELSFKKGFKCFLKLKIQAERIEKFKD